MKRKSAIFTIVACSIAAVFLTAVLIIGLHSDGFGIGTLLQAKGDVGGERNKKYTYTWEAEDVTGLEISWVNGPIELKVGTGETIEITESADQVLKEKEKLQLSSSDGILKIKWNGDFFSFGLFQNKYKALSVTVPANTAKNLEELKCSSTSGNISATGFTAEEAEFSSTSGTLEISDISGEDADFSTVSGGIGLSDISLKKDLHVNTASGSVSVEEFYAAGADFSTVSGALNFSGKAKELSASSVSAEIFADMQNTPDEVSMEAVSGKLTLAIPENEGFHAQYSSISGKFSSDFPVTGTKGKSGDALYGSGKSEFSFSTTSGAMKIIKKAAE